MKIAIIADPFIPVPPINYGGIERIIDFLTHGLAAKGHELLLVANKDSTVDVPLLKFPEQRGGLSNHLKNIGVITKLHSFKPEVIHSFGRLAYLLPFVHSKIPKIMSYQREPTIKQIVNAKKVFRKNTLSFTGCSDYISNQLRPFATASTVYNGVQISKYEFADSTKTDAPLVFLGRIEPIKGTHLAIHVAKQTGKRLVIAGNIPSEHLSYFEKEIKSQLNDQISYIGPVNDHQKNELLGNASAFLMPIQWNEPFGIVMAEAMACGTPVIGINRGAVPEIVDHEMTGFVCKDVDEMISSVKQLHLIDRKNVRQACESRFSSEVIIEDYLSVYRKLSDGR